MTETWTDVIGYEGRYMVSDLGRLMSLIPSSTAAVAVDGRKYLKATSHSVGYKRFRFGDKTRYVHRVVWESFHGKLPEHYEINHKDLDKTNNRLDNLEMMTRYENLKHAVSIRGEWRTGRPRKNSK